MVNVMDIWNFQVYGRIRAESHGNWSKLSRIRQLQWIVYFCVEKEVSLYQKLQDKVMYKRLTGIST